MDEFPFFFFFCNIFVSIREEPRYIVRSSLAMIRYGQKFFLHRIRSEKIYLVSFFVFFSQRKFCRVIVEIIGEGYICARAIIRLCKRLIVLFVGRCSGKDDVT